MKPSYSSDEAWAARPMIWLGIVLTITGFIGSRYEDIEDEGGLFSALFAFGVFMLIAGVYQAGQRSGKQIANDEHRRRTEAKQRMIEGLKRWDEESPKLTILLSEEGSRCGYDGAPHLTEPCGEPAEVSVDGKFYCEKHAEIVVRYWPR